MLRGKEDNAIDPTPRSRAHRGKLTLTVTQTRLTLRTAQIREHFIPQGPPTGLKGQNNTAQGIALSFRSGSRDVGNAPRRLRCQRSRLNYVNDVPTIAIRPISRPEKLGFFCGLQRMQRRTRSKPPVRARCGSRTSQQPPGPHQPAPTPMLLRWITCPAPNPLPPPSPPPRKQPRTILPRYIDRRIVGARLTTNLANSVHQLARILMLKRHQIPPLPEASGLPNMHPLPNDKIRPERLSDIGNQCRPVAQRADA